MLIATGTSASSAGVLGSPLIVRNRTDPTAFTGAPFESGVPIVRKSDASAGGLHELKESGAACTRFGVVHGSYTGTSGAKTGVAAFGRGCWTDPRLSSDVRRVWRSRM